MDDEEKLHHISVGCLQLISVGVIRSRIQNVLDTTNWGK